MLIGEVGDAVVGWFGGGIITYARNRLPELEGNRGGIERRKIDSMLARLRSRKQAHATNAKANV